ncbi:MAG: hypothetical protein ABIO70_05735 [Pseudomonadota bacterium]
MGQPHSPSLRETALGLTLLVFLWTAVLHILIGPLAAATWPHMLIVLVRYALLVAAGALVRPWWLALGVVGSALLWGLLDLLATTGLFSVYSLLVPSEPFLYFQF